MLEKLARWASRKERELVEGEEQGRVPSCYRAYSQLFMPFALAVLVALPLSGREIIWNVDGLSQYYAFFVYEGRWLRSIVGSLFSGAGLQIPLWEWCSGYGADIPVTFDVFLDPLNLVSAITPVALSEWVFQALVVLRMYLAGLFFVYYCRTRGENRTGAVLGALLYALGGTALSGVRWASGLHGLVLFPLVLAGAERILERKSPWVFIASFSLLSIVSYYFTYMACLLLVAYLALRVVQVEGPALTPRRFVRWVGVYVAHIALCFAIAAFALVPAAMHILGMERFVDGSAVVPFLYEPIYYLRLVTNFLSTSSVGSDYYQGFGGLAFLACVALLSRRDDERGLRLALIALSACFLLPLVGSLFNVMNYATNRWAWGYALCMALVLVRMTPRLRALDARTERALVVAVVVYGFVLLVPAIRTEANVAGYAALLSALGLVLYAQRDRQHGRALLTCALGVTLAINGFYFLASDEGGQASGQVPLGMAYNKLSTYSVDSLPLDAGDSTWWRYDAAQSANNAPAPINRIPNNALVLGLQAPEFYNSVYEDKVDAFNTELGIAGTGVSFRYDNLQGRTDLMALLGVKYYAYRADGSDAAPYGFGEEVLQRDVMGIDYRLLKTSTYLPIGYVFDKAISRSDYLALTPAQRQQALLQTVVLDEDTSASERVGAQVTSVDSLALCDQSVPYTVAATHGVEVEEGRFVVAQAGGSVTLVFEGTLSADTYLYVSGLTYHPVAPSELVSEEALEGKPWYYGVYHRMRDFSYIAPNLYGVIVKSNASPMSGYIYNMTTTNHMYCGKDMWLVNAGYAEVPATTLTLTFTEAGRYEFDDLQVVTQTHERLGEWVAARSQAVLDNVHLGCNELTGTIELAEPGTLLITETRANGWTAYVDGAPAELLCVDTAFMGIDLAPGRHTLELRYETPGLRGGCAITGLALLALAAYAYAYKRRTTRARKEIGSAS